MIRFLTIVAGLLVLVGCSSATEPASIESNLNIPTPSLVVFYTDN